MFRHPDMRTTPPPARHVSAGVLFIFACLFMALLLSPASSTALEGRINLNTATVSELQKLPFIGIERARAIVDYRRKHGPFEDPGDLLKSRLVGTATLDAIRPYLKFSGPSDIGGVSGIRERKEFGGAELTGLRVFHCISTRPGDIRVLPDSDYYYVLRQFLSQARHRIDMAMFLFKTTSSPKNRPSVILRELIQARKRGVRVSVLLEKSGYDPSINRENRRVARLLKRNRVNVRFDSPDTTTHVKIVVIDGRFVFVGSHNLTQAALAYNHEFSLLIDSVSLAREVTAYLNRIH